MLSGNKPLEHRLSRLATSQVVAGVLRVKSHTNVWLLLHSNGNIQAWRHASSGILSKTQKTNVSTGVVSRGAARLPGPKARRRARHGS